MIWPLLRFLIPGRTALTTLNAPKRLESRWAFASSREVSSSPPVSACPALLTRTSIRPAFWSRLETQVRTDSSEVMSSRSISTPSCFPPAAFLLVPKALNPRSASSDKVSFPKPEEAPVMRTILSSSNQGSGFVQGPRIYTLHQDRHAVKDVADYDIADETILSTFFPNPTSFRESSDLSMVTK